MSTEFITDVIDVPKLIGFVREAVVDGRPLEPWSPSRPVDDIEYELTNIDVSGAMQVAKYRSWDTAPPIGKRPGVTIIGGEIPPMGLSVLLKEKDIIRLNKLRAALREGVAADADSARVVDTVFNDGVNMAQAVNNRITWAQAELIRTGTVTVEGSTTGGAVSATFDVPGGHLNVTPAGDDWSVHATAVPITDLAAWTKTFKAANGGRGPDFWITSSDVVTDLTLNAQVRNLSPVNADGSVRGIVNATTVAQVLQAQNIAPIVPVDLELPRVSDGVMTRIIPERSIIGIIVDRASETLFGPSANAAILAGMGQIAFRDAAGVIAFVEQTLRPAQIVTTGEAVALPVLKDPKAIFSATV